MLGVWKPTRPPDFPDHYFDFMHSVISKKRLPFLFWFRTRNVVFISEIFFQEITVLCEEIQSLRYKVFGRRYLWQHSKHPGEKYFFQDPVCLQRWNLCQYSSFELFLAVSWLSSFLQWRISPNSPRCFYKQFHQILIKFAENARIVYKGKNCKPTTCF
jgi:hypothetical protein